MKNTTIMRKNFLEIRLFGNQNFESIKNVFLSAVPLLDKLYAHKMEMKILVEASHAHQASPISYRLILKVLDLVPYSKMAITLGSHRDFDRADAIIMAAGKSDHTKLFSNRREAKEWLSSN